MLSVSRNIALPNTGSVVPTPWVNGRAERQVAEKAAQQLRIRTHSVDTVLDQLSGGNQQKVVLSRWTSLRSKVLVLDNPTNGIDVGAKTEIYRLIRELAAQGAAVMLISSELPEILHLADRIVVMSKGRIVWDRENEAGGEADVAEEEQLVRAALGLQASDVEGDADGH